MALGQDLQHTFGKINFNSYNCSYLCYDYVSIEDHKDHYIQK